MPKGFARTHTSGRTKSVQDAPTTNDHDCTDAKPTKHTQPFTGERGFGMGVDNKHFFEKTYFFYKLKRGALAPRFAISYHLSYQNAILSSMYFFTSVIGILSCFIESRSRTVTQPSSTLSKSYVMQKGVPISSCLLYLLPIAPASS